jgi:beta-N-acetylhexosaminidase
MHTLDQAGLHIVVCPAGHFLDEEERRLFRRLRPAGIHLRVRNFLPGADPELWLQALTELLRECRELSGRPRQLVVIDHEGARVHRLPAPGTHFPWAVQWGHRAGEVARAMATELLAVGVNAILGPVADVASNPANPVIGPRAFAADSDTCARRTQEFITAAQALGLACCAKHFPGHGDTHQDSHFCLPAVDHPLERLHSLELPPFRAAIGAGCRMVMSAHLVNPHLDPDTPATLSRPTLQQLLRTGLGFEGVVISDDMEMAAITGLPDPEPEVAGLIAGLDLLLYNHHPGRALAAGEAVGRALAEGRITPGIHEASARRIEGLLAGLPEPVASGLPAPSVLEQHARLARDCALGHPLDEQNRGFEAL